MRLVFERLFPLEGHVVKVRVFPKLNDLYGLALKLKEYRAKLRAVKREGQEVVMIREGWRDWVMCRVKLLNGESYYKDKI